MATTATTSGSLEIINKKSGGLQAGGVFRLPVVEKVKDYSSDEKLSGAVMLEQRQQQFWTSAIKTRLKRRLDRTMVAT